MSRVSAIVRDLAKQHIRKFSARGDGEIVGCCPFHEDRTASFAINEYSGLWVCYAGCGGGTLSWFLYLLGYKRRKVDRIIGPIRKQLQTGQKKAARAALSGDDPFLARFVLPEAHLGCYDCNPPPKQLLHDGFDAALLKQYDVGFDRQTARITWPIRDLYGNLAGFSGRTIRPGSAPKYLIYEKQLEKHYPGYRFDRSRHLWNMDRVYPGLYKSKIKSQLVVVEGFKACLWLVQSGFHNTVALMGSGLSRVQAAIIHRLGTPVILFLDNDETGHRKTSTVGDRLYGPISDLRAVVYPHRGRSPAQPDWFDSEELGWLLEEAEPFRRWLRRHA